MTSAKTSKPLEEVVAFFASGPSREEIARFRLSEAARTHVRELLEKNAAGELTVEETVEERRELDKLMVANEVVSLIKVRAQAAVSSVARPSALTGA